LFDEFALENVGAVPDFFINKRLSSFKLRIHQILVLNLNRLIEDEKERKRIAENGYNFIKQITWEILPIKR
jgi:hypothetical protein